MYFFNISNSHIDWVRKEWNWKGKRRKGWMQRWYLDSDQSIVPAQFYRFARFLQLFPDQSYTFTDSLDFSNLSRSKLQTGLLVLINFSAHMTTKSVKNCDARKVSHYCNILVSIAMHRAQFQLCWWTAQSAVAFLYRQNVYYGGMTRTFLCVCTCICNVI